MRIITTLSVLFVAHIAFAIPQQINYQGQLTRTNGTPLDTTVAMTFRLFNVVSGGTALWTETHPSVIVTGGLFQVLLGSATTLPDSFTANTRWLGVTVGNNTEMTPRRQIASVPYSYRVGTVDGASGGNITSKINVGSGNVNPGTHASVFGSGNSANADFSVVTGGAFNTARGDNSFIGGGAYNRARGNYSVVGGGGGSSVLDSNSAAGENSTVGGGKQNQANGVLAAVGGGQFNVASNFATIAGGVFNTASGTGASILGGNSNTVSAQYASVSGGASNNATATGSSVSGGINNMARGTYSVIAGGGGATASDSNSANADHATIGGGRGNQVTGIYGTVAGGQISTAGISAFVGGGYNNRATGQDAVITGGSGNIASGGQSTVPGGVNNEAAGLYTFAAGRNSHALHHGSFVWGDGWGTNLSSTANDQFLVRASGGLAFYTNNTHTSGVTMAAGGNAWVVVSDSTKKRNIRLTDTESILQKMLTLPLKDWEYQSETQGVQHLGPMAQDFWNAFHLGSDSLGIATNDADGVLFAAVQELAKQNEERKTMNEELKREVQELRALVQSLAAAQKLSSKVGK